MKLLWEVLLRKAILSLLKLSKHIKAFPLNHRVQAPLRARYGSEAHYPIHLRRKNQRIELMVKESKRPKGALRSSQIDPLTELCEIAIKRSIIVRTLFDAHRVSKASP